MSVFDIFTSKAPAPVAPTPATPGNIPAPTIQPGVAPGMDLNGLVPAVPTPTVAETPLTPFTNLWDDVPSPNAVVTNLNSYNPQDIATAMGKIDLSSAITPEHMQAITHGGQDAAAAFAAAMQAVAQKAMVQATLVSSQLTKKAVEDAVAATRATLPDLLREQGAQNHMRETNPLFSNPAVKPVIEAARSQLLSKYPNATHSEITGMVNDYIRAMGTAFAPPAPNVAGANDVDWEAFMKA